MRVSVSPHGTFGVLLQDEIPFALTLERTWAENAPFVSAIPTGAYVCRRTASPSVGMTFEVTGVPGRTHILFHRGNRLEDTAGCILVGEEFGADEDRPILAGSTRGFMEFLERLKDQDEFELRIVDAEPPPSLGSEQAG